MGVSTRTVENHRPSSPRARRFMPAVGTWLVVMLAFAPALAQPRQVQLSGRVQWIAADKLMLILDGRRRRRDRAQMRGGRLDDTVEAACLSRNTHLEGQTE
jgi:hypothetical protein